MTSHGGCPGPSYKAKFQNRRRVSVKDCLEDESFGSRIGGGDGPLYGSDSRTKAFA